MNLNTNLRRQLVIERNRNCFVVIMMLAITGNLFATNVKYCVTKENKQDLLPLCDIDITVPAILTMTYFVKCFRKIFYFTDQRLQSQIVKLLWFCFFLLVSTDSNVYGQRGQVFPIQDARVKNFQHNTYFNWTAGTLPWEMFQIFYIRYKHHSEKKVGEILLKRGGVSGFIW